MSYAEHDYYSDHGRRNNFYSNHPNNSFSSNKFKSNKTYSPQPYSKEYFRPTMPQDEIPEEERQEPAKFNIVDDEIIFGMNVVMGEELVGLFQTYILPNATLSKSMYAFYKKVENEVLKINEYDEEELEKHPEKS